MHSHPIPSRRLNPFAFPAETNARSLLLILSLLMFAIGMGKPFLIALRLALVIAGTSLDTGQAPAASDSWAIEARLGGSIVVALVPAVVAGTIYLAHPGRIRRRRRLEPVDPSKHLALEKEVDELSHLSGVSPVPAILVSGQLKGQNAQAFGLPGKNILGLDGGLRLLLLKARAEFRAVILHELAHIANGDIGRTYFAEALWRGVLYTVAVPFALLITGLGLLGFAATLWTGTASIRDLAIKLLLNMLGIATLLAIFGVPLSILAFFRAGLLRTREAYADIRVAIWGLEEELRSLLARAAAASAGTRRLQLMRSHPSALQRLEMLQEGTSLFKVTFDLPLIAGLLIGFVTSGLLSPLIQASGIIQDRVNFLVVSLVGSSLGGSGVAMQLLVILIATVLGFAVLSFYLIVAVFLGYLVAAGVGLQLQRETVAALATGRSTGSARLFLVATLTAIGFEAGALVTPPYGFSPLGAIIGGLVKPTSLLLVFPWLVLFAGMNLLGLLYVRVFSRQILGSHSGTAAPIWKIRLLTFGSSCLLGLSYSALFAGRVAILYPDPEALLTEFFLAAMFVNLVLYGVAFGGTWLAIAVWRSFHPIRCHSCGEASQYAFALDRVCDHCGRELAPWLLFPVLSSAEQ
jgi:Zn-dependent protease with chaperone function